MNKWTLFFWLICSTFLVLPLSGAAQEPIVLRAGDIVKLNLPGEADFEQHFQINQDGMLILPEVGQVTLGGMRLPAATQHVKALLAEQYRAIDDFALLLIERRLPVRVLGFVKAPGMIDLPADGNIQLALQQAGWSKRWRSIRQNSVKSRRRHYGIRL